MIIVYAIYEPTLNEIYVGLTNNLDRRLNEHSRGKSRYTKKYQNFRLIFKEEFQNYKEARIKEKYYKSVTGKEFLKTLL